MILVITINQLQAQDLKKEFDAFEKDILQDFQKSIQKQKAIQDSFVYATNEEFLEFITQSEKDFAALLIQSFHMFTVLPAQHIQSVDKPVNIDPFLDSTTPHTIFQPLSSHLLPATPNGQILPNIQKSIVDNPNCNTSRFNFLGQDLVVYYDTLFRLTNAAPLTPVQIKQHLMHMLETDHQAILSQLCDIKITLGLNDWDYLNMVREFCKSLSPRANEQNLMAWFLLLQSNFQVKIGFYKDTLLLFYATTQNVYGKPSIAINGIRYYFDNAEADAVSSYDAEYFKSYKSFNLIRERPLLMPEVPVEKKIAFSYQDSLYHIILKYNSNYINYLKRYPILPLEYHFNPFVSSSFIQSIDSVFLPLLHGRSEEEKLSVLLHFVQSGFAYNPDMAQFGIEKYMEPEEMLYYDGSDCDDRTILFSFLVSHLLHNDLVALYFKGHVCAAVHVKEGLHKGSFNYMNAEFIVCDPTYMGAPLGQLLPPFKLTDATIVDFISRQDRFITGKKIWEVLNSKGLFSADNSQNLAFGDSRKVYATGYDYKNSGEVSCNNDEVPTQMNSFISKLNGENEIVWTRHFQGSAENLGYSVCPFNQNGVYVFGYFEDSLRLDDFLITSQTKGSFYLARLDSLGNTYWLKRIDIPEKDSLSKGLTTVIDSTGLTRYYMPNYHYPLENSFQMQTDHIGYFYLYASLPLNYLNASTARIFSAGGEFDVIGYLVQENNHLMNSNYPKSLSLLFTLVQYLGQKGSALSGSILQNVIIKNNPDYPASQPKDFQTMGRIASVNNVTGIIQVTSKDKNPLVFKNIRAVHESSLKIILKNGNIEIIVLRGMEIGDDFLWNKLNSILLDKNTGKIVYDYDNHYRKKMPVHSNILN